MIALGIDPGSRRVGYGVVKKEKGDFRLIAAGLLRITSPDDSQALREAQGEIEKLILLHKPDVCGVEKIFFSKNRRTGIAVAQTRGVLLAALAKKDIHPQEFSPNEIKLSIAGWGKADKKSVEKMVRLTLREPDLRAVDDVYDALAVALCALSTLDTQGR